MYNLTRFLDSDEDLTIGPTGRWYLPSAKPWLYEATDERPQETVVGGTYGYWALRPDEIRIIFIERATDFEAPLRCKIKHGPIYWTGDFDPYITLSYCWGELEVDRSHLDKQILCEEGSIPITTNLDTALRYIRWKLTPITDGIYATYRTSIDIGFWIDAICINQNDIAERNEQVTQMSRIYSNSSRLIVWLDVPSEFEDIDEPNPPFRQVEHSSKYRNILKSIWFSRRWIIEEYALTPIHSRFYLWRDVFIPCYYLSRWLYEDRHGLFMHERFGYDTSNSLLYHLYRFDEARCSDPRDLIYSLLPISQALGSREVDEITVDYGQSVEACFLQAARSILKASEVRLERLGLLLAIAAAKGPRSNPRLPSWVPDWREESRYLIPEHQRAIERMLDPFEYESYPAESRLGMETTQIHRDQQRFRDGLVAVSHNIYHQWLIILGRFLIPCFPPLHPDQDRNGFTPYEPRLYPDHDMDRPEWCWTCAFFPASHWERLQDVTKGLLEKLNGGNASFMIPTSPVVFVLNRYSHFTPDLFELSTCLFPADVGYGVRRKFFQNLETVTIV